MQAAEAAHSPQPNPESGPTRFARIVQRFKELDERVRIADTLEELTGQRVSVVGEEGNETFLYGSGERLPGSSQRRWSLWVDVMSEELNIFVDQVDEGVPIGFGRRRTVLTYTPEGILQFGSDPKERMQIYFHEEVGEQIAQQNRVKDRIQKALPPPESIIFEHM